MDFLRNNYNKCSEQTFKQFIDLLNKSGSFVLRSHRPADKSVLQDRYTFTSRGRRISLVYETKAQTLVVTAPSDIMNEVVAVLPAEATSEHKREKQLSPEPDKPKANNEKPKSPDKPKASGEKSKGNNDKTKNSDKPKANNEKAKAVEKPNTPDKPKANNEKPKAVEKPNTPEKPKANNDKPKTNNEKAKAVDKPKGSNEKTKTSDKPKAVDKPKGSNEKTKTSDKPKVNNDKAKTTGRRGKEQKAQGEKGKPSGGVFKVDKIDAERCKELLKKIKANKSMRYKTSVDDVDGSKTYAITSGGNKAIIRYSGGSMQLSGAPSDLYSELQLMLSGLSDYKTAIDTHIKYVGEEKRSSAIERQLKKKLPAAFEFLSEQSKIDLAIGIIDINNSAVVLSDYSTLLIPCFRGLERLIFDLQHAQNISVKMIGQAYEKEDGVYVLKAGYRRKIPSVVYAEVMAALYGEYVARRNFYAHSDNSGNVSRVISDKSVVLGIFNHIMDVINYNGKKLQEIGFRIKM